MSNIPQLTARERSIALLIAQELTDSEIAYRLGLSCQHVKNTQITLRAKLNVISRVGVALAVARGEVQ